MASGQDAHGCFGVNIAHSLLADAPPSAENPSDKGKAECGEQRDGKQTDANANVCLIKEGPPETRNQIDDWIEHCDRFARWPASIEIE